jgi:hypothetical protein
LRQRSTLAAVGREKSDEDQWSEGALLVEEEQGVSVALQVARELVVFLKRPECRWAVGPFVRLDR